VEISLLDDLSGLRIVGLLRRKLGGGEYTVKTIFGSNGVRWLKTFIVEFQVGA
jgi:hypothetical protein